jgi:hypothetical protein
MHSVGSLQYEMEEKAVDSIALVERRLDDCRYFSFVILELVTRPRREQQSGKRVATRRS